MNYEPELNFAIEFNLSRNGMIEEIRTEYGSECWLIILSGLRYDVLEGNTI